jgi:hypothetical protein
LVKLAQVELIDGTDASIFGAKKHGIDLDLEDGSRGRWIGAGCWLG